MDGAKQALFHQFNEEHGAINYELYFLRQANKEHARMITVYEELLDGQDELFIDYETDWRREISWRQDCIVLNNRGILELRAYAESLNQFGDAIEFWSHVN
jgi:hypothetical protein